MGSGQTGTSGANTSLNNAVPGTPTGLGFNLGSVYKQPIGVVVAGAGISAGVVDLEGSLDGVNWYKVASSAALAAPGVYTITGTVPCQWVRCRVSTATVGGNVTAQVGAGG